MTVNVIAVEGRIGHVERYRDKVYTGILIQKDRDLQDTSVINARFVGITDMFSPTVTQKRFIEFRCHFDPFLAVGTRGNDR